MKLKKKMKFLFILIFIIFSAGITYSVFSSTGNISIADQNIAKFIFNSERSSSFDLLLNNLKPGDKQEFDFLVSNNNEHTISDVVIAYQITIKTYHFIPITIKLYKANGEEEIFIYECDESYSRNEKNELVCNSPIQEMNYDKKVKDNYKLKIEFPKEYNDISYSNLADFVSMEIKSWQKLES